MTPLHEDYERPAETLSICIGTPSGSAESGLRRDDGKIQDWRKVDWV